MGGSPAFVEPLHVGRPGIGDPERFFRRMRSVFEQRVLTNGGPLVQEFEARVAAITGARHAIAVASATSGLHLVAVALGLEGEVIVPSFTFISSAHVFHGLGMRVVFADVDPGTGNLDPAHVERLISPATGAIVGVHLWGRPCSPEALESVARRHGIALVLDAAHAFACSDRGRMVGTFGRAEVFSFHATKFVNSFEGGAITTNDEELAAKLATMRSFGFVDYDRTAHWGTNAKMSEASAAMGLTSLDAMRATIDVNRTHERRYAEGLAHLPGIRLWEHDRNEQRNHQHIVISVDRSAVGFDRDALQEVLIAENVLARRYFAPGCHRMEPYLSLAKGRPPRLPVTERLSDEVLSLPTGPAIDGEAIDTVCAVIGAAVRAPRAINQRLGREE